MFEALARCFGRKMRVETCDHCKKETFLYFGGDKICHRCIPRCPICFNYVMTCSCGRKSMIEFAVDKAHDMRGNW